MARAPNIVQRISLDGGTEIEQLLKRLGAAGEEAFKNIKTATEQAEAPLNAFRQSLAETGQRLQEFGANASKVGKEITQVGKTFSLYVTAPITAGFALAAKSAIDFESAMADVRKVVNFPTPDGLDNLKIALRDLTQTIPLTATELAQIAAAAGQAGVAADDLAGFTEIVAKATIAFGLSADDAGTALAKIKTALGLSIPDVQLLADAMNQLANNMAASEPEVLDVVSRVAALGEVSGITAKDVAAVGAAMVATGVDSERAATGLRNIFLVLGAGKNATSDQIEAFKQLGLSSEQVAKDLQTKGVGVLVDIFERISKQSKEVRASIIEQLFGKRVVDAAAPLINNLGVLRQALGLVADDTKFAGSAQREFDIRMDTTRGTLLLLRNALDELAKSFGNLLLPVINSVSRVLTAFFLGISKLPGPIKAIILLFGGVVAAVGPLLVVVGLLTQAFGFFVSKAGLGLLTIAKSARLASIAFTALRTASLFLVATPIGAILLGIAAAVIALSVAFGGFDNLLRNVAGGLALVFQGLTIVLDFFNKLGLVPDSWVQNVARAAIYFREVATNSQAADQGIKQVGSSIDAASNSASDLQNETQKAFDELVAQGHSSADAIKILNERLAETGSANVDNAVSSLKNAEQASWDWRDALKAVWDWLKKVNSEKSKSGGAAEGKSGGGLMWGAGTSTSDSIPARLSRGEYVIKTAAVKKYGVGLFHALNSMRLAADSMGRFNMGGLVSQLTDPFTVPRLRFASGGEVPSSSGRPLTLVIDGKTFNNLSAPEDTAQELAKFARSRQVRSAGRKPGWYGG